MKFIKALLKLAMIVSFMILIKHEDLSNATIKGRKDISSYVWIMFVYIVGSLSISIVVNLIEVVQYLCTGTTWIDWILYRSVLIDPIPLNRDVERARY